MALTVTGEGYREFSEPRFFECETLDHVKQIRNPVDKAHAVIATDGSFDTLKFDSSSSDSDDGVDTLESNNSQVTGRWKRTGNQINVKMFGAKGDGTTDDTSAIQDAVTASNATGKRILFPDGTYPFSSTLRFTASNSGIIGSGQSTILLYTGAQSSIAIEFANYTVFTANASTDVITAVGHGFSVGTRVEVSTHYGTLPAGLTERTDYYVGTVSGDTFKLYTSSEDATSETNAVDITDAGSGTLHIDVRYGASKEHVRFEDFYLKPDFTQAADEFGRPTDWFSGIGIYLRGARNKSMLRNLRVESFSHGIWGDYQWMCRYESNRMNATQYGITLLDECNNMTLIGNMLRRCGDVNNITDGYGMKVRGSYGFSAIDTDLEVCNCYGFIYEQCHAFNHIGGDIEANDLTLRKIVLQGKQSSPDFDANQDDWTRGANILGVRLHRSLGVEIQNGVHSVNISGCTFRLTAASPVPTVTTAIRTSGTSTHIRDIQLGPNDYYGDNDTYYPTPMASFRFLEKNTRPIMSITSPPLDVTDANGYQIGYIADDFEVTKVQIIEDTEASTSGVTSLTVDIGINLDVGTIASNLAWSPPGVALYLAPFGVTEYTSDLGTEQSAGLVRARIGDLVGGAASGSIKVRVFYKFRA